MSNSPNPHHPPLSPTNSSSRLRSQVSALEDSPALSTRGQNLPQPIRQRSIRNSTVSPRRKAGAGQTGEWRHEEADLESLRMPGRQYTGHRKPRISRANVSVSGDGRGIDLEGWGT